MKGKVENRSGMVVLKDYVYGLVDHSLETSSAVMTELLFSCITSLRGGSGVCTTPFNMRIIQKNIYSA